MSHALLSTLRRVHWQRAALVLGLTLALGLVLLPYRTTVAGVLWDRLRVASVATALDPGNARLAFSIAEYYFNHGAYDIETAKRYYERAIALQGDYIEAHYQLARIHFLQSDFVRSLAELRVVLELDPEFKRAYYMSGLVNGYNGNLIEAAKGFEQFIERDSFNWAGYNDLAWVYFQLGDFEKTLRAAEQGLAQAYGNAWLLNMRGLALMNLDRRDEAHQAFADAKAAADRMSAADWGIAYPGNDPAIYASGLDKMREAIEHNFELTAAGEQ